MLILHHHRRLELRCDWKAYPFDGKVIQLRPDTMILCSSEKYYGYEGVYSAGVYLNVPSLATAEYRLGTITMAVQLQKPSTTPLTTSI